MKTKVIIVDPEEIVRCGVRCLLETEDDIEVVGDEADGRKGLELAKEKRPDVVITEVLLEGLSGVDLTERLGARGLAIPVVVLSDESDPDQIRAILQAGAMGFLLKTESDTDLVRAVHLAIEGKSYISPEIARLAIGPAKLDPVFERLTTREREILQLLADGKGSKQIAYDLELSSKTIDAHRQNIMRKLDVDSLAGLVKAAIRAGLTTAERDTAG